MVRDCRVPRLEQLGFNSNDPLGLHEYIKDVVTSTLFNVVLQASHALFLSTLE